MNAIVSTPRSSWIALGLIVAAAAILGFGYLQGRSTREGFQGAATVAVAAVASALLGFAGIVCAFVGARQKPWSFPTKIALLAAIVASLSLVTLAVRIVVVLSK